MKLNFRKWLFIYLLVIFSFSVFYLYIKHSVGNDSTISEWLINYNGGFTRRGMGGEITIFFADLFNISLRKFASTNNLKFVDVTEISRRGIDEPNLIAGDSLHPSGIMYLEWAKKIYEIWTDYKK